MRCYCSYSLICLLDSGGFFSSEDRLSDMFVQIDTLSDVAQGMRQPRYQSRYDGLKIDIPLWSLSKLNTEVDLTVWVVLFFSTFCKLEIWNAVVLFFFDLIYPHTATGLNNPGFFLVGRSVTRSLYNFDQTS